MVEVNGRYEQKWLKSLGITSNFQVFGRYEQKWLKSLGITSNFQVFATEDGQLDEHNSIHAYVTHMDQNLSPPLHFKASNLVLEI